MGIFDKQILIIKFCSKSYSYHKQNKSITHTPKHSPSTSKKSFGSTIIAYLVDIFGIIDYGGKMFLVNNLTETKLNINHSVDKLKMA